jgi:Rps23 Pro-64 3,4-dihydroxylase Tpa1-like proline 4-hydroxylase
MSTGSEPLRYSRSGSGIDFRNLERRRGTLADQFRAARPIPHVVIDDSIDLDPTASQPFPSEEWPHWRPLDNSYQTNKRFTQDLDAIPEPWNLVLLDLASPRFLEFLEEVTGIRKLIPDPYLIGGGLHESTTGGVLAPHTDFHFHARLELFRRLNVIIYLNPDWMPGDGGELDLVHSRRSDRGKVSVNPTWGRMVIFETNDVSVHGFTAPVRESTTRRSIAAYFYTSQDSKQFSGDATTYWRDHGRIGLLQYPRYVAFRVLMQASRAISLLAHLANPNLGAKWWRNRQENNDDSPSDH